MGFGMQQRMDIGHRQELYMVQKPLLSMEQKLELKQVFALLERLRDPPVPSSIKGIEGLIEANSILIDKRVSGLLIGGLAEEVYNPQISISRYEEKHKDVDVMVIPHETDGSIIPSRPKGGWIKFEGGIDWWHPSNKEISYWMSDAVRTTERLTHWKNGHNVVLMFGLKPLKEAFPRNSLESGLYIPSVDFLVNMRLAELDAAAGKVEVSEETRKNYEVMLRWKMRLAFPKVVKEGAEDLNPYQVRPFLPGAYAKLVDKVNLDFSARKVKGRLERKPEFSIC